MESVFQQEQQQIAGSNRLIIDGDSIIFMLGYPNKEHQDIPTMHDAIDRWMQDLLLLGAARSYIGILANEQVKCFRYECYKYRGYKANRPSYKDDPEMEWLRYWKPIITKYLVETYGFVTAPAGLEADDAVASVAFYLTEVAESDFIICSPDKDLKQMPGKHMSYKMVENQINLEVKDISAEEALNNLLMQLIVGDSSDNIAGVPGLGEVKAKKLLQEAAEGQDGWMVAESQKLAVKNAYTKYFDNYYGQIIYEQTFRCIKMVTPTHPMWDELKFNIEEYVNAERPAIEPEPVDHGTFSQGAQ